MHADNNALHNVLTSVAAALPPVLSAITALASRTPLILVEEVGGGGGGAKAAWTARQGKGNGPPQSKSDVDGDRLMIFTAFYTPAKPAKYNAVQMNHHTNAA